MSDVSTSDDLVFVVDAAHTLVSYALDSTIVNATIKSGEFALHMKNADCLASAEQTCSATVTHFQLEFGPVSFPVARGTLDAVFAADVPLEVANSGDGFVIGSNTPIQACMSVDGQSDSYTGLLNSDIVLNVDSANGLATVEGLIPFQLHQSNRVCELIDASVSFVADAKLR